MKLESLKNSKFNAFKENELSNSYKVLGGVCRNTKRLGDDDYSDWYDCDTKGSPDTTVDGKHCDFGWISCDDRTKYMF